MEWPDDYDVDECVEAYCYYSMITNATTMDTICALLTDDGMFEQMKRAPTPRRIDAVVAVRQIARALVAERKPQHSVHFLARRQ